MHSAEQDLDCPGCGANFPRLGAMISHIELSQCRALPKQIFDATRKEKGEWDKNHQAVRHDHYFGRNLSNHEAGPSPLAKPAAASPLQAQNKDARDGMLQTPSAIPC